MSRFRNNTHYLLISLILAVLGLAIYTAYHDIMIPGLPEGSYRQALGTSYLVPAAILLAGQLLVSSLLLHSFSISLGGMPDYAKALLVASLVTALFAATYAIFPFVGPFYYIVAAASGGHGFAIPVEIGWTVVVVAGGAAVMRHLYQLPLKKSVVSVLLVYVFLITAAS